MNGEPTSQDPDVHSGDVVFRGTRVPVEALISVLLAGGTVDEFLDGYPSVSRAQVEMVLERLLRHPSVVWCVVHAVGEEHALHSIHRSRESAAEMAAKMDGWFVEDWLVGSQAP